MERKSKERNAKENEKQLEKSEDKKAELDLNSAEEVAKVKMESIKKIKPIFEKYNALSKEHGILKDELNAELKEEEKLKEAFAFLKSFGIVKKTKGRYYYSVENEERQAKLQKSKAPKIIALVVALIVLVAIIAVVIVVMLGKAKKETKIISDGTVSFNINENWISYANAYETGWNYYKYINTIPPTDQNEVSTEEVDYSKYPAYLNISYYKIDTEVIKSIEDVKNSMKKYIDALESKPETYEEEISKNKAKYDMLALKMHFREDKEHKQPEQVEYLFYILNGESMACIDTYSFNIKDEKEIEENARKIAQTFKWQD